MALRGGVLKFISKAVSSGHCTSGCLGGVPAGGQAGAQSFTHHPASPSSCLPPLSPSEQLSHFLGLNLGLKTFFPPTLGVQWIVCGAGGILHGETRGGNKPCSEVCRCFMGPPGNKPLALVGRRDTVVRKR